MLYLSKKNLKYFDVDMEDELSKTIKSGSEVDCATLLKMGFHKVNNVWTNKDGEVIA